MVRCLLVCFAVTLSIATPSWAGSAPGRVVLSVATKVPQAGVDAAGAGPAVALPDNGVVMIALDRGFDGLTTVALRSDGALDPSYGDGGIARVPVAGLVGFHQLLRQPDGRLIAVATRAPASKYELPRLVLVRLTSAGMADESFGSGGVAALDLQSSCSGCAPAALAPDGSIVITGNTGSVSPQIETNPSAPATFAWVVRRLNAAGASDDSFGTVTIPGAAGLDTGGFATVVRPSGEIVVLGSHRRATKLAGLTASGAPDPSFNAGAPAPVPVSAPTVWLPRASGAIDVLGADGRLVRVTPTGGLDADFGAGGIVALSTNALRERPALVAAPDGGTLLQWTLPVTSSAHPHGRLRTRYVSPSGATNFPVSPFISSFGGGVATPLGRTFPLRGVRQDSFDGRFVARPDGSYLAVGAVKVIRATGEKTGFSAGLVAVAAFRPFVTVSGTIAVEIDERFGGPHTPASLRVAVPRQSARAAARLRRILLRVTASEAGLVAILVRDGRGRLLARSTEPLYRPGMTSVRLPMTARGQRLLRRARELPVRVRYDYQGMLTNGLRGGVSARLGTPAAKASR